MTHSAALRVFVEGDTLQIRVVDSVPHQIELSGQEPVHQEHVRVEAGVVRVQLFGRNVLTERLHADM